MSNQNNNRAWFAAHPNYQREYRAKNLDKVRKKQREYHLNRTYGITQKQYEEMLSDQDGRCAICRCTLTEKQRYFDVDHDHATGRIRGLVCRNCNRKLGWLERFMPAIITYLGE